MADILSQEEIDALLEVVDENVDIQNVQKKILSRSVALPSMISNALIV